MVAASMRSGPIPTRVGSQGLSTPDARRLLAEHGPNRLPEPRRDTLWRRALRQSRSPIVYVLLVGFAVETSFWVYEGAHGAPIEAIAIAGALVASAAIGAWQEHRGERALEKLRAVATPRAWVFRDGQLANVSAEELVPGDLVRLEAGGRLPADGIITDSAGALVDESVLSGESIPIEKREGDEVSAGTMLVRGRAHLSVTRTGPESAMGRLATLLVRIEPGQTPLEKRLKTFGDRVALAVIALGTALVAVGLLVGGRGALVDVVFFAVALAVAAVPEELPAVLALTLALGVERMAKRNALVRRLSAVEALGSVTVIATDKTGTLTENRLHVKRLHAVDERAALRAMVLANDADLTTGVGDPLEVAFLRHGQERGIDLVDERAASPRVSHRPFDSAWMYMRVTLREGKRLKSYLKGAPEVILARCSLTQEDRSRWSRLAEDEARQGYRVLALAKAEGESEEDAHFLGLVALWDPPRAEVPEAIRQARSAGVEILMITGDHPATARAVADAIGIGGTGVLSGSDVAAMDDARLTDALRTTRVFARVTPEQKLRIVEALQARGEIVAVTGDGINDAPALKRADVGVAMGQRGSDVAREVADLVLLDDNFATIVHAIEEGRSLYQNIQAFIRFMFSTSLALLLLVLGGTIGTWLTDLRTPTGALLLPLTAIQILFVNLFVDGPPSLAIGLDKNPDVMNAPPRSPGSPLLDRAGLGWVVTAGVTKAGIALALLLVAPALGFAVLAAQTAVFAYEYLAQLVYAYPARRFGARRPRPNPTLAWTILGVALLPVVVFLLPPLRVALGLEPVDGRLVAVVAVATMASWGLAEAATAFLRPRPARARSALASHP